MGIRLRLFAGFLKLSLPADVRWGSYDPQRTSAGRLLETETFPLSLHVFGQGTSCFDPSPLRKKICFYRAFNLLKCMCSNYVYLIPTMMLCRVLESVNVVVFIFPHSCLCLFALVTSWCYVRSRDSRHFEKWKILNVKCYFCEPKER